MSQATKKKQQPRHQHFLPAKREEEKPGLEPITDIMIEVTHSKKQSWTIAGGGPEPGAIWAHLQPLSRKGEVLIYEPRAGFRYVIQEVPRLNRRQVEEAFILAISEIGAKTGKCYEALCRLLIERNLKLV